MFYGRRYILSTWIRLHHKNHISRNSLHKMASPLLIPTGSNAGGPPPAPFIDFGKRLKLQPASTQPSRPTVNKEQGAGKTQAKQPGLVFGNNLDNAVQAFWNKRKPAALCWATVSA